MVNIWQGNEEYTIDDAGIVRYSQVKEWNRIYVLNHSLKLNQDRLKSNRSSETIEHLEENMGKFSQMWILAMIFLDMPRRHKQQNKN